MRSMFAIARAIRALASGAAGPRAGACLTRTDWLPYAPP